MSVRRIVYGEREQTSSGTGRHVDGGRAARRGGHGTRGGEGGLPGLRAAHRGRAGRGDVIGRRAAGRRGRDAAPPLLRCRGPSRGGGADGGSVSAADALTLLLLRRGAATVRSGSCR